MELNLKLRGWGHPTSVSVVPPDTLGETYNNNIIFKAFLTDGFSKNVFSFFCILDDFRVQFTIRLFFTQARGCGLLSFFFFALVSPHVRRVNLKSIHIFFFHTTRNIIIIFFFVFYLVISK